MQPMGMNPTQAMSTMPSKPQGGGPVGMSRKAPAKRNQPTGKKMGNLTKMKGKAVKTPKVGQKVTLKPSKPGQKKISFKKGGLHASLGVPQGKKIPASKKAAALAGKYGAKAKKEASFDRNILTGRKAR